MKATVSAVIPVYNNEPYIGAAVDSVLSQTLHPTEIIVVDDGSTDGTAAALSRFRDKIKYVYQQNRGEPAARNRGIRESIGEYVAFLDGDDLWQPNKLQLQMEYLGQHPHCSLVYSDMSTFNEKGIIDQRVSDRFHLPLPSGRILPTLFMTALFGSGSVVFRKECVDTVGYFDEELLVGSDYDMWLRIARHFELGVVDEPLLMYRHHLTMSTRGLGLKMHNGMPWEVAVLDKTVRLYPEVLDQLGESAVRRRMSKPYAGLAYAHFELGDRKMARSLARKALDYWPTNRSYWMLYGATLLHPTHVAVTRSIYRRVFGPQNRKAAAVST